MLLQVVRQPTDGEMKRMVEEIRAGGLTRDEARSVRKGQTKKEKGYVFKYKAKNQSWSLMIKFRKSQVKREEMRDALMSALNHLDDKE
jgi:hypothetical protein